MAGPRGLTVNTWRYQMENSAAGTDITESFELADTPLVRRYWRIAGSARGGTNLNGMRATLEKLEAVSETGTGA